MSIRVETDYADEVQEFDAAEFAVDSDTEALFLQDEDGADVAVFAPGKWLSAAIVKQEDLVEETPNLPAVEEWAYPGNSPSDVYVVVDRFGDEWFSHMGRTFWKREKDGKDVREVEYTGPFRRPA